MIKAIRTTYKGTEFRSRTEARWAVFFEKAGIPWIYEREGYQLPSGWYVPDFWLSDQSIWWEVKGKEPSAKEIALATELAAGDEHKVFIAVGSPGEQDDSAGAYLLDGGEGWDVSQQWAECLVCGRWDVVFGGQGEWRRICNHPEGMELRRGYGLSQSLREMLMDEVKRYAFWEPK